ncbi:MAG: TraB/GumN family protein [Bacteroidota bacterium]
MTQKLIFLFSLFFISCHSIIAQKVDKSNYALLWEITGKGLEEPSYLFGTMHLRDPRVFEFSDSVLLKLDACEAFATEVHPDSLMFYYWDLYFNADTTNVMKKLLSDAAYQKLNDKLAAKMGKSLDSLVGKDPNLIDIFLKDRREPPSKNKKEWMLDNYLYKIAYHQGKKVFGVESAEDHFLYTEEMLVERFEGMAKTDTIEIKKLLEANLERFAKDSLEKWGWDYFVGLYQSGDIEELYQFVQKPENRMLARNAALVGRNAIMVDRFEAITKKHSLFCAVGAAHLGGEEGMIQLLRERGYTMRKVTPSFTGLAEKYKEKKIERPWYTLESKIGAYSVKFPAKPYQIIGRELKYQLLGGSYIYYDIISDVSYVAGSSYAPVMGSDFDLEEVYESEFEKFGAKETLLSEDNIRLGEFEGKAYWSVSEDSVFAKTWIFLAKNQRYAFRAFSKKESSAEIDKFFNSIYIEAAETTNWHQFTYEKGAFALQIPTKPQHQELKTPTETLDGEEEDFTLDLWMSTDTETGDAYIFRYNDVPAGLVYDHDSIFFASSMEEMTSRPGMEIVKNETVYLDGYEGRDFIYRLMGISIRVRLFLRGQRTYLLLQQMPKGSEAKGFNEAFFRSLQFLDFQETDLIEQTQEQHGFTAAFPSKIYSAHDTLGSYEYPQTEIHNFYSLDTNVGSSFNAAHTLLSPYYEHPGLDSFYNENYDFSDTSLYTINQRIDTTLQGIPARYYQLGPKDSKSVLHYLFVLHKNSLYDLYAYLPKELNDGEYFWKIVSQFKIDTTFEGTSIFTPKKDAILQGIQSKDENVFKQAKLALDYHDFVVEDLPDLYKAMQLDYPSDTAEYRRVFTKLSNQVAELSDSTTYDFLLDLFSKKSNKPYDQIDILANLQGQEHPDAIPTFFELLPKLNWKEKDNFPSWRLTSVFQDSFALFQQYYPNLRELAKDTLYTERIISTINNYVSRDTLDLSFIEKDKPFFYGKAEQLVAENQIWASDTVVYFDERWVLQQLLNVLYKIEEDREKIPFFQKFVQTPDAFLATPAVSFLIKKGEKIPKKTFAKFAEDEIEWLDMLQYLYDEQQLHVVPKKLYSKEYIARAHLRYYMEYDYVYEELKDIKLLKKLNKKRAGEEEILYFYNFKVQNSTTNYLAVVTQPKADDKFEFYSYVFDVSEEYDPKSSLEEQINSLLEYYDFE